MDKLTQSIKKLSQYDEWQDIMDFLREIREAKIQSLAEGDERMDAKKIGAIVEDDFILSTLIGNSDE